MSSEVPDMLRRLAAADGLPAETDAPAEQAFENPVAYDPGLQQQLEELGPEALREFGQIIVRDTHDSARYNSAVWYALAYDLAYEHRMETAGDYVRIYDPEGAA